MGMLAAIKVEKTCCRGVPPSRRVIEETPSRLPTMASHWSRFANSSSTAVRVDSLLDEAHLVSVGRRESADGVRAGRQILVAEGAPSPRNE